MQSEMILGPPGCGKTSALVKQYKDLVASGVAPESIGFLTFSKSATEEIRIRLGLPVNTNNVTTIHAMCFRAGNYSREQVIDDPELFSFSAKVGLPLQANNSYSVGLKDIISLRSRAVNRMITTREEISTSALPCAPDFILSIVSSYENYCESLGILGFDDMLRRFVQNPVIPKWTHLIIDEGQDLTPLQWRIIKLIIGGGFIKYIVVAADDDQSLNEFSGAAPQGVLNFGNEFNSKYTILSQSWRIPATVHELAERIISRVKNRIPKVYMPRSEVGQVVKTSDFNIKDVRAGTLILCRSKATRVEITTALNQALIPYVVDGAYKGPYFSQLGKAARKFRMLQSGEALSKQDFGRMAKLMLPAAAKLIVDAKYTELCKLPIGSVFQLNEQNWSFYTNADFLSVPQVKISTIHASKGREANHVMLCGGMTERIVNGLQTPLGSDAEHRVWYVGVTRARHKLTIFNSNGSPEEYQF